MARLILPVERRPAANSYTT